MVIEDILKKLDIEVRHWSDVFTSTVGTYEESEYLYRIKNETEIRKELIEAGLSYDEAQKQMDNYAKQQP